MKFTVSLLSLFVASLAAAPSPVQSADAKIAMIQAEAEASASPVPSPSPAPSPSAAPASPSTNPIVWPTTQRQKIAIQQAGSAAGTVGDQCPYNKKFKDLYIPGVNLKDLSYCAQLCFRDAWNLSECCAPTRRCACSSPLFTMGFVQCLNYACTNSAMMEAIQWGIIQCTSRYCDDDDVDCH